MSKCKSDKNQISQYKRNIERFLIGKKKKLGVSFLKVAAVITILLPVILGAFAAAAWDRFFVLFHELSFENDLWLFDPAVDPIINVLPDQFFFPFQAEHPVLYACSKNDSLSLESAAFLGGNDLHAGRHAAANLALLSAAPEVSVLASSAGAFRGRP